MSLQGAVGAFSLQEVLRAKEVLLDDDKRKKYEDHLFSPMRIYVKTGTSRTTSFLVPLSATVSEVKDKVSLAWPWVLREEMVLGLPGWHVAGRKMEDARSLAFYRVKEDQVLHLVVQSLIEQELMGEIKEGTCKNKGLEQKVIEGQNREEILRGIIDEEQLKSESLKKKVLEGLEREENLNRKLIMANNMKKQLAEELRSKRTEAEEKGERMKQELEALKYKVFQDERLKNKAEQELVELREKIGARNITCEVLEAGTDSVGKNKEGIKKKKEDHNRDEKVVRKSSRIKRKAVEQPGEMVERSSELFKTVLSRRLFELSENSTGGERPAVVRNGVKKSFMKGGSKKRGNLVKCIKKVEKQETKTTILCSEPGCGKKSGGGYRNHRNEKHLGVKLHKCKKANCPSYFYRGSELDDHMRKKHGYPMLGCDAAECKETFFSSGGLRKHKKKH